MSHASSLIPGATRTCCLHNSLVANVARATSACRLCLCCDLRLDSRLRLRCLRLCSSSQGLLLLLLVGCSLHCLLHLLLCSCSILGCCLLLLLQNSSRVLLGGCLLGLSSQEILGSTSLLLLNCSSCGCCLLLLLLGLSSSSIGNSLTCRCLLLLYGLCLEHLGCLLLLGRLCLEGLGRLLLLSRLCLCSRISSLLLGRLRLRSLRCCLLGCLCLCSCCCLGSGIGRSRRLLQSGCPCDSSRLFHGLLADGCCLRCGLLGFQEAPDHQLHAGGGVKGKARSRQ